jgi:hypothetical protein
MQSMVMGAFSQDRSCGATEHVTRALHRPSGGPPPPRFAHGRMNRRVRDDRKIPYSAVQPPSIERFEPVICAASSLHR